MGLMRSARAACMHPCIMLMLSAINVRVYCLHSVVALHGNERAGDLPHSGAGRLILHGLSKWGEEDRSHCSHYRMHPAVVPSAWIHMSGQTDLSLALSALEKTKMLNTDMYSTFMKTWANSLCEGSVERWQMQKKQRDERHFTAEPVLRSAVDVRLSSQKCTYCNGACFCHCMQAIISPKWLTKNRLAF